jgi:hypothetical protein
MKSPLRLSIAAFGLALFNLSAATLYVALESTNPGPPYTSWATAATNIQQAVDAAQAGDTVLVTNGVFSVGSREISVLDTNTEPAQWVGVGPSRVVVTNSITLESVNGPEVTVIEGSKANPDTGEGTNLRCAYLSNGAVLSGFTLTKGRAAGDQKIGSGGGVRCELLGSVTNCVLTANSADFWGGGVAGGSLDDCVVTENGGLVGGGAWSCTLRRCTLSGNGSMGGGGADTCTLYRCTVTDNVGRGGGGAVNSTLYNCLVKGNNARWGGGVNGGTLYGCTVVGNSAGDFGGGVVGVRAYNCIVVSNTSAVGGNGYGDFEYSCTTPLPDGPGNIDADALFVNPAAGDYHLRPNSPCIDAGTNLSAFITTDIVGEFRPWDGNKDGVPQFDMGAYEFRPSPVTLYVSLESTNPVPPYATWDTAATNIQDAVDAAKAGHTVLVTNGVYAVGSRDISVLDTNQVPPELRSLGRCRVAVTKAITLQSVNGPSVTTIEGDQVVNAPWGITDGLRCVYLGSHALLNGFTLAKGFGSGVWWRAGAGGGGLLSESDGRVTHSILRDNVCMDGWGGGALGGSYEYCTFASNRVVTPIVWQWDSYGGAVANGVLYNCTLTDNQAGWGGGASGCTLYNCVLTGNRASADGGGAVGSTLCSCTLTGNSGGGADGTLYHCLVTGNDGGSGGVLYNCTVVGNNGGVSGSVFNSIVYYNSGGNYAEGTALNYCCTFPLPTNGVGSIIGPPLFMDMTAGDFRLREDSPCIDAGTNLLGLAFTDPNTGGPVTYAHDATDILGNTRFIDGNGDGTVAWDIGAYEFNSFKPPRFTVQPQPTPDGWRLNIAGAPNKWARLQRSSDLKTWEDLWFGWMGAEGVRQCNDGDMGQKVMFYRAVVP